MSCFFIFPSFCYNNLYIKNTGVNKLNKKELQEIKRTLKYDDSSIHTIYTCYATLDGEKIFTSQKAFVSLTEEERAEYTDIFKKILSTKIERNFINVDLDVENEAQKKLFAFIKKDTKEDIDAMFTDIISNYKSEENFAVVIAKATYDLAKKSSDGAELEGGDEVYNFYIIAICPVRQEKGNLYFDNSAKDFATNLREYIIFQPEVGLLYPAFSQRSASIYECGYYIKNTKNKHEEFQNGFLNHQIELVYEDQKEVFNQIIEDSFLDLGIKELVEINEKTSFFKLQQEENEDDTSLRKSEIKAILQAAGADVSAINIDEDIELKAENLTEDKYVIETDGIKIIVKKDYISNIKEKEVDGIKSLVLPLVDMTMNKISIK